MSNLAKLRELYILIILNSHFGWDLMFLDVHLFVPRMCEVLTLAANYLIKKHNSWERKFILRCRQCQPK